MVVVVVVVVVVLFFKNIGMGVEGRLKIEFLHTTKDNRL